MPRRYRTLRSSSTRDGNNRNDDDKRKNRLRGYSRKRRDKRIDIRY